MGIPSESNRIHNLAWAVLANNVATGKAEVVKVTNQDDADATVQNDPNIYYKSGPFVLTWMSLPVIGYAVFVYFKEVNRCHAPHFPDIESAEEFANDLRAMSDCEVAEPIAITPTTKKQTLLADF